MNDKIHQALDEEMLKVRDAVVRVHTLLPKPMSLGSSIRTISQAYCAQRNEVRLIPHRIM